MVGYVVRRLVTGGLVLVAVTMVVFVLFFYGPTDPALAYCPVNRCPPERLEQIRSNMGLDQPVARQYVEYMSGFVRSREITAGGISVDCPWPCLGVSFKYKVPVFDYLWSRFPATLSIAVGGAISFLSLGIATGVFAARRRGTTADKAVMTTGLFISAFPYYMVILLAYIYLVQGIGLFPDTGYHSPFEEGPIAFVRGLLLPWIVLGVTTATAYARFTRGTMIDTLNEDYVRTARAKGVSEREVVFRHALRAAIVPVVTIFGLDVAYLLAGTYYIEKIFGIPGLALAGLDAVARMDLPMVSGTVLISATVIVVANIVVDILYTVLDPRVRLVK
jgi:peptide/nickel transport system permease protein